MSAPPKISEITELRQRIDPYIVQTPVWKWDNEDAISTFGAETEIFLKLELFQRTGTFKPRGALAVMLDMDDAALAKGVTAVSAGNHAIAVAYAAQLKVCPEDTATVVLISTIFALFYIPLAFLLLGAPF